MENNPSCIQGKTWYWRKGIVNVPILGSRHGSGPISVRELCLIIDTPEDANIITQELAQNNIFVQQKKTHRSYEKIPKGSLIVFAREANTYLNDEEEDFARVQQNLNRLKNYIHQKGGKINEEDEFKMPRFLNIFNIFKGGRK